MIPPWRDHSGQKITSDRADQLRSLGLVVFLSRLRNGSQEFLNDLVGVYTF
jgi:hypothetical protein